MVKKSPRKRHRGSVHAGERVSRTERDRRLDARLAERIAKYRTWGIGKSGKELDDLLDLLRYGARLEVSPRKEWPAAIRRVAALPNRRRKASLPAYVRILAPFSEKELGSLNDAAIQSIRPGKGWKPSARAAFHYLAALVFGLHYSDAFLGVTITRAREARAYYTERDAAVALDLAGREMRAAVYAFCDVWTVVDILDAVFPLYEQGGLAPADEYGFILQACEALMRWEPRYHDERLQVLARRGLELAKHVQRAEQVGRLHQALAIGLLRDEGSRERARAEWERAVELEKGEFCGRVEAGRRDERIAEYLRHLLRLAVFDGRYQDVRALAKRELAQRGVAAAGPRIDRVVALLEERASDDLVDEERQRLLIDVEAILNGGRVEPVESADTDVRSSPTSRYPSRTSRRSKRGCALS